MGFVQKPHALKGEVKAVFRYQLQAKRKMKTIYLGEHHPVPYFVEQLYPLKKNVFVIKISDCSNRSQAELICGKKIHVSADEFEKHFEADEAAALIGYQVVAAGQKLGVIDDVFKLPQQHLAQVIVQEKEILIPLNEETVQRIEKKKRTIFVRLPDGLLDI